MQVNVILSARNGEQFVLHVYEGSLYEPTGHTSTHLWVDGSAYLFNVHGELHNLVLGSA